MKERRHYYYIYEQIGSPMDRKTKIIIPDFNCEMEFKDGGIYSGIAMERKIAEAKLESLIWCYQNDNRPLPETTEEDVLTERYDGIPMLMIVEVGVDKENITLDSEDLFKLS